MLFDEGLNVFLKYVPEEDIDDALVQWYAECDAEYGHTLDVTKSDYYDLIRPALVVKGFIDDSTGDEI